MKISFKQVVALYKSKGDACKPYLIRAFEDEQNLDVFGMFLFPEAITTKPEEFHTEILQIMCRDSNDAIAAPRGHGKSTTVGLVFLIHRIIYNRIKYCVYMSENHNKSVQFITPIRDTFKNNDRVKWLYGEYGDISAKDDYGRDREDCIDINKIRIEAISFDKNLRGFRYKFNRPDLIIADDIENDERVANPQLRRKDERKLNNVVIPSLSNVGVFKFIGTILNKDSLLMKKIKLYKGRIYRAIDENGSILAPKMYNKEKLMKIKNDIGTLSFNQEYLNDPSDNEASIIKEEWLRSCLDYNLSIEEAKQESYTRIIGGVDFAFSDSVTADKSEFMSFGQRQDKKSVLLFSESMKGKSGTEQINFIKNRWNIEIKHNKICLEENSIKSISKDIMSMALPLQMFWTGNTDRTNESGRITVSKINMIKRLGTSIENKKFIIPYKTERDREVAEQLIEECTSYGLANGKIVENGVHPDKPIAMGFINEILNGQTYVEPTVGRGRIFG